jgi:hypothetical protein
MRLCYDADVCLDTAASCHCAAVLGMDTREDSAAGQLPQLAKLPALLLLSSYCCRQMCTHNTGLGSPDENLKHKQVSLAVDGR